jgi:hypothetical protein
MRRVKMIPGENTLFQRPQNPIDLILSFNTDLGMQRHRKEKDFYSTNGLEKLTAASLYTGGADTVRSLTFLFWSLTKFL